MSNNTPKNKYREFFSYFIVFLFMVTLFDFIFNRDKCFTTSYIIGKLAGSLVYALIMSKMQKKQRQNQ